jgi:hypothetical protein
MVEWCLRHDLDSQIGIQAFKRRISYADFRVRERPELAVCPPLVPAIRI